jgi:dephospho-CoA kinase
MKPAGIRIIGLTGGIATGKSSVAQYFQMRGGLVIDADQLARSAVERGSRGLEQVTAAFGAGVLDVDGQLDRKQLSTLVFADPQQRAILEGILHPEIRQLAEKRIAQAAKDGRKYLFYMAPLLIEAGVAERVDEIWVVTVRPEVQLERLMKRDGISREDALRIIASQMPLAEKETFGRVVIDNSGTPEETERLLTEIWLQEIEENHE